MNYILSQIHKNKWYTHKTIIYISLKFIEISGF